MELDRFTVRSETLVLSHISKRDNLTKRSTRVPACGKNTQVTGPRVDDLFQGYTAGQKPGRIVQ
jgi:hypothetical protein